MPATVVAAMSGTVTPMLVAATTGSGTVITPPSSFKFHNFLITGAVGVTSGAVQIETSNDPNDAGTWAPVTASPTTVVATADVLVTFTGLLNFIRARVSTTIAGGGAPSVTVNYEGGKS